MKKLLLSLALLPLLAPAATPSSAILANARLNALNKTVTDCPFDADLSYGLSYAIYDGAGYLEFGANYAPSSSQDIVDDVWTPYARLVMVDQFVAIGIGIRDHYIAYNESLDPTLDSGWSDLLYELYLGLEIPLGPISLGGGAYYAFSDWSDAFSDFESKFLDYGVHFGFQF